MMTGMSRPTIKLNYADYLQLPDDGNIHEIIDGDHYMSPAPGTDHQRISRRIQFQLMAQIEQTGSGEVFNASTDLQLSDFDIVQPDLLVILRERGTYVTPTKIIGPPALVVEILSPSTSLRDRSLKLDLYARVGVAEYWIADPEEREVVRYVLEDGGYREAGPSPRRNQLLARHRIGVGRPDRRVAVIGAMLRGLPLPH